MGDRAIVIVTDGRGRWSPSIYLHWHGSYVKELLKESIPRIRRGDVSYTCARIIGTCHTIIEGNLSLGIFDNGWQGKAWEHDKEKPIIQDRLVRWTPSNEDLRHEDQGDNGVFIFDCITGQLTQYTRTWNDKECRSEDSYDSQVSHIDLETAPKN